MSEKILIITGGPISKLDTFREAADRLRVNIDLASFYDLNYSSDGKSTKLLVKGTDVLDYDVVYLRVVGKRLEDASILVEHLTNNGVKLVDQVYQNSRLVPSTISKGKEMFKLAKAGIPIPKTYYASVFDIKKNAVKKLGFPYVIKCTVGQKARAVWSPSTEKELEELLNIIRKEEIQGKKYFAQQLIKSTVRVRIFVVGGEVYGAIVRSTKFRKKFQKKINGEYPEKIKETWHDVPDNYKDLALSATSVCGLDISGIDILVEEDTEKLFVIEANAAPAWYLIKKYTQVEVEEVIIKYLIKIANKK